MRAFLVCCAMALSLSARADDHESFLDLNGDGKDDIWYEYKQTSYTEFVDRNYDGKADMRTLIDSTAHWPLLTFSDDDFDGVFETRWDYQNSVVSALTTDANGDGCLDIVHFYQYGSVVRSEKIERVDDKDEWMRSYVDYEYEFPTRTRTEVLSMDPCDFAAEIQRQIPTTRKMPPDRPRP
ncbi:MAG: hypothetical protein AAFM91_03975 [Pseudomonadota bacterium]